MTPSTYTPTVVHVNAPEGQPSTFWKSQSGKYYRTKAEAIADKGKTNVDPNQYAIKVGFFVKYKNYVLGATIAALVAAALFYFAPKIVAKLKK